MDDTKQHSLEKGICHSVYTLMSLQKRLSLYGTVSHALPTHPVEYTFCMFGSILFGFHIHPAFQTM
jgi:hypothetical protein